MNVSRVGIIDSISKSVFINTFAAPFYFFFSFKNKSRNKIDHYSGAFSDTDGCSIFFFFTPINIIFINECFK